MFAGGGDWHRCDSTMIGVGRFVQTYFPVPTVLQPILRKNKKVARAPPSLPGMKGNCS